MKRVSVIGAGIIGLSTAYYLALEGYEVEIFDREDTDSGCSYGNAGMIVPSHIIPLAQPGMIAQGIKWMFDSKSPFYVRPRLDAELLRWGWKFYKNATNKHVEHSMPALRDLSLLSKELYKELDSKSNSFNYEEKGLLMLFKTEKTAKDIIHEGELAQKMGLEVDFLTSDQVNLLEKGTETDVIGGVHFKSDAHLYPQRLIRFLKEELKRLGVVFRLNNEVTNFEITNSSINKVVTKDSVFETDEVILATGSWSPSIAKKIGSSISLLPGKGYSFTLFDREEKPSIPSILCEGKVAVTPMDTTIRFGGTMEITNNSDTKINRNRLQGIVNSVNDFYPNMKVCMPKNEDVWYGFRPCTPSGMPIITRDKKINNLIFATGHAMMGLSLATGTGKVVTEIVSNQKTSVDTKMFQLT